MRSEPGLRRRAIGGEVEKLGVPAGPIENAHHAGLRPFDDGERQRRACGKGLEDLEHHDAGAAKVALVQRETRRCRVVAARMRLGFADEASAIVVVLPSRKLVLEIAPAAAACRPNSG